MPFLFKRIRENLYVFLGMGLIYFFAYHKIANTPKSAETVFVSCAGFLLAAMIVYICFLRSYLLCLDDLEIYVKTNLTAYAVFAAVFYVLFGFSAVLGGDGLYSVFFAPYDVLTVFGASRLASTFFVHITFFVVTLVLPCVIRKQENDRYLERM